MPNAKPIIVIQKKGGHGGHHGGAWKVAYADFVTALMSLFIVLWLMNTSQKIRQAVAGYFNDPRGKSTLTGTDQSGSNENLAVTENNVAQLKKKIEEAIRQMNDLKALQNQIQITITPEGLRIELLETKDGTFFDTGSARLNQHGQELLQMLAGQLGGIPNRVAIEGHTDAQPYSTGEGYGNWELSTDRANAARRLMQASGLGVNQVSQVRGYADQKLRVPENPLDPSNRRISLIVQYLTVEAPVETEPAGSPVAGGATARPGTPGAEKPAGATDPGSAEKPAGAAAQKSQPPAGGGEKPPRAPAAPAAAPAPHARSAPAAVSKLPAPQTQSAVARLWAKLHQR
jgi:chemotaxis protein MotB